MSLITNRPLLLTAALSTLALGGTFLVKPAFAGTASANLAVSATVLANCTISATPLSFGNYNPESNSDGSGTVSVTCTSGAPATIKLGQGSNAASGSSAAAPLRQLSNGAGGTLRYDLFQNAGRTTAWGDTNETGLGTTGTGSQQDFSVFARVPSAQGAAVGSYTDTVVATVDF